MNIIYGDLNLISENINKAELCRAGKKGDGFLPAKVQWVLGEHRWWRL